MKCFTATKYCIGSEHSRRNDIGRTYNVYSRYRKEILEITSRYPVTNVRVFGSIARGDDYDTSDLDLLVDPLPGATLLDLGGLQDEIQSLL